MEDKKIVELFFRRNEAAIDETRQKYGKLLLGIAKKLVGSDVDSEECLNDALFSLWRNIPPVQPESLRAYSCKVIRNLALKRLTYNLAEKRSVNSAVPLDELEAVLPDGGAIDQLQSVDFSLLLEDFLRGLNLEARVVFLKRYFFMDSVPEIAEDLRMSEGKVNSLLWRARNRLRKYLNEKGAV